MDKNFADYATQLAHFILVPSAGRRYMREGDPARAMARYARSWSIPDGWSDSGHPASI